MDYSGSLGTVNTSQTVGTVGAAGAGVLLRAQPLLLRGRYCGYAEVLHALQAQLYREDAVSQLLGSGCADGPVLAASGVVMRAQTASGRALAAKTGPGKSRCFVTNKCKSFLENKKQKTG